MMYIREYKSYGPDIALSLPKGSRFLDARYSLGSIALYFEVTQDYTLMQTWNMFVARQDESVERNTGWTPDMYSWLATLMPVENMPLAFIFWKHNG